MKDLRIRPLSLLRHDGLQRVDISATMEAPGHYRLSVYEGDICRAREIPFALPGGKAAATVWLTPPAQAFQARWVVMDSAGAVVAQVQSEYPPPRRWTFYVMVSSHIDLGLPNAPHVQRAESARFIEAAVKLSHDTANRPEESRYRYVAEGTWVWNSHRAEYGAVAARATEAARRGDLGVCAGVAGNHIQSYGLEELCRSAYSRKWLLEQGVWSKTMTMIDVPGLPWSMVQPYADAGYENIIFAPNNYAPKLSTVWRLDSTVPWPINNPESVGGGTRIDVRYDGHLPMLFYWEGASKRRLLIWASAQYGVGGERFGISAFGNDVRTMADRMAEKLPKLEARVPYDIWLVANYYDNMEPELSFADSLAEWNRTYAYPQLRIPAFQTMFLSIIGCAP